MLEPPLKKALNFSEHNFQAKLYLGILISAAVAALLFSAIQLLSFSFEAWMALSVSAVICLIVCQYQFKVPRTNVHVSMKELLIFWAVIWLGLGGSVLIGAISSIANYRNGEKNRVRWIVDMASTIITTFVTTNLFYITLSYGFNFTDNPIATNPINAFLLFGVLSIISATHYLLYSTIYSIFLKLEGMPALYSYWRKSYLWILASGIFCVCSVFFVHLLLVYFRLSFGLLILPITIMAHLSYRFHRQLLAQKTKEIREASRIQLATVEALATAIDARDQIGRGHVTRTQIYAVGIGRMLHLSQDEIQALSTGALLHDIGKLAVPDHILNKPGKLTESEMEKMKIHPAVGASILEDVNFPYPVISTIKFHHERWDGKGYPKGLKNEEIPLTARILSIADAYDTLRSIRPYHPAVSRKEARRLLINGAGTQFDPKIVDVFMRNLNKFEEKVNRKGLSYELVKKSKNSLYQSDESNKKSSYVEQIKSANREVSTLYELARVFSSALTLEDTLSLFVEKVNALVPLETCVVYLLDQSQKVAIAAYALGKNSDSLTNRKVKIGQGATGYALKNRKPIYNINPGLDFSFYQIEFIQEYTTMASVPLTVGENLLGAVSVYSCELDSYEDEHMRLLETVSRIAADAISVSLRHAETETKAFTDTMTSLPNARSLQIQFEKEIGRAKRNGTSFQLLMLDLDGFKAINDTYGHKAGDKLLKEIAMVMRKQLRDYDFLARYAGDEFVAIIPETDKYQVVELAQRMEKAVREYKLSVGNGKYASVGVSLGVASYPQNGETLDQIIIAADKAMYAVKDKRKAKLRKKKALQAQLKKSPQAVQTEKPVVTKTNSTKLTPSKPIPVEPIVEESKSIKLGKKSLIVEEDKGTLIVEVDKSHIVKTKNN